MNIPRLHLTKKGSLLRYRWFAGPKRAPMDFRRDLGGRGLRDLETLTRRIYHPEASDNGGEGSSLVDLGRALYRLLIPEDLHPLLKKNEAPLAIHGVEHLFPWEVLHDGEQFLGLRFPIGRLPGWFEPASQTSLVRGHSSENIRVVMVADPLGDLPGAAREADYVVDCLPTQQPKNILTSDEVTLSNLSRNTTSGSPNADDAMLLHIAANVQFKPSFGPQIPLQDNSLSTHQLRLLYPGRLLAFLHLQQDEDPFKQGHSLIVPFASSLLEDGALGCVVSLRSHFTNGGRQMVGDYYRYLFEGYSPAKALTTARQRFLQRNPDDPSWSTFVYFGEPGLTLLCNTEESQDVVSRPLEPASAGWNGSGEAPSISAGGSSQLDKQGSENSIGAENTLEYDFDLEQAIGIALMEAKNLRQDFIGTPHLFIGLTKCPGGVTRALLESSGFDPKKVRDTIRYALGFGHASLDAKILPTQRCARALKSAEANARKENAQVVREKHLLTAILQSGEGLAFEVLKKMGADPQKLHNKLLHGELPEIQNRPGGGDTPTIDRYGRDLTLLAEQGRLPHLTGRSVALMRLAQILLRRFKNNPLIIGDAGVGKTALVEGLAQRIVAGAVPEELRGRRLVELSLSSLVAGTRYRGDFEERLTQVIREAREHPNVILFLDEFHTVVGAGETHQGTLDAANILKPALARGELRCIGATTPTEYRKYIEKDAALERRFHPLFLDEPSIEDSLDILRGSKIGYEEHHKVTITSEVLSLAVDLAVRFLPERRLPDKALDLIDEACALVTLRGHTTSPIMPDGKLRPTTDKPLVTEGAIHKVLSDWTGIPVGELSREEGKRLLEMPERISKRVLGQPVAVSAISQAVQLGRAGLKRPGSPTAVMLFIGPSGVGKTELCRVLASELFGQESAIIRLDMSEYSEKHSSSRLLGAPPGYVGYGEEGQILSQLHHRPYSVVLLDEIEKAHPEVLDVFLQLFEEGRLTDSLGRLVDGRHAVFIMTSNLMAERFHQKRKSLGFQSDDDSQLDAQEISHDLRRWFRPEFLNRIDEVILFHPLSREVLLKVARLRFDELVERANSQDVSLSGDDDALKALVDLSIDPALGARPLLRTIEKFVSRPLSQMILSDRTNERSQRLEARLRLIDGEAKLIRQNNEHTFERSSSSPSNPAIFERTDSVSAIPPILKNSQFDPTSNK